MSNEFETEERARQGRRRFIGAGAGLLGLAWSTQASAGWNWYCARPRPCFLSGTRIETETGLVPVEDLKAGDRVKTLDGQFKAIRWIGLSTAEKTSTQTWSNNDAPVLITKGAFGDGMPRTDLRVSPHHAFYFDGVLVRAKDLVNGLNVKRETNHAANELRYFHVELDRHDVIFAEGALAETYRVQNANRVLFDNAPESSDAGTDTAPFAPILGLTRKEKVVVQIKSALLPSRNHAGRIGEINRAIIARAGQADTNGHRKAA